MTVKERLLMFIKSKGLSQREFCRKCNLSSAFVSNISKSISEDKLLSIAEQFPDLNKAWLMLGEGDMTIGGIANSALQSGNITIPLEAWSVIKQQAASLESRDKQIETRDRHIDDLIAMLKQQIMPSATSQKAACG